MCMSLKRETTHNLLLLALAAATVAIYLALVPQYMAADDTGRALLYLVIGWVPYTAVFYVFGRRVTSPDGLPNMRTVDIGLSLVLVSLLASLGLDRWGVTPERLPEAHVLQAVGIFVGLALAGWGLGHRSAAIEQMYAER